MEALHFFKKHTAERPICILRETLKIDFSFCLLACGFTMHLASFRSLFVHTRAQRKREACQNEN